MIRTQGLTTRLDYVLTLKKLQMSFNIKIRTTDKHYFDARDSIGIHVLYK